MRRAMTEYPASGSTPWIEYWPLARVIAPELKPVRGFLIWIWAPSTGFPFWSVTVPLTAPVVTPWARRRAEAPVTSANDAATVTSRRVLSMNSLCGRRGGHKVASGTWPRQENFVTARQRTGRSPFFTCRLPLACLSRRKKSGFRGGSPPEPRASEPGWSGRRSRFREEGWWPV